MKIYYVVFIIACLLFEYFPIIVLGKTISTE